MDSSEAVKSFSKKKRRPEEKKRKKRKRNIRLAYFTVYERWVDMWALYRLLENDICGFQKTMGHGFPVSYVFRTDHAFPVGLEISK